MADLSFGALGGDSLQDTWGAALSLGANNSFLVPRTSDTVTANAVDGSAPIDNSSGGSWTGFWQDTLKAVVGYQIAKDAAHNAVAQPGQVPGPAPGQAQAQASAMPRWLLPALIAGGAVVAVIALRK